MSTFTRRHPIGVFLAAVYAIAVIVYALPVLSQAGLGILPVELPGVAPFLLVLVLAMVGVSVAITAVADGREGVRDLRRRAFRFRTSLVWYATALLLLPASALAMAVVVEGPSVLSELAANPAILVDWLVNVISAAVIINLWEELVWTGFLLHRLQPRVGPIRATALTTWAQAAIHVPLIVVVGGVSDTRVTPDLYPFFLAALFVFPLGNRAVATWLYNRSNASVPVIGLTHAGWNLAAGSAFIPALVLGYVSALSYVAFAVVALVLIAITRGALGFRTDASASPDASVAVAPAAIS